MPLGVHSEVGRLRRVMVHRPGLEHTRLTPSNAEELLFDDVIWVARAKAEHDMFVEAMRDRGVEVFLAEQLLAEALAKPEAKDWVCSHILNERQVGITASRQAREWVETAEPATVAEFLIGGMTKADVRQDAGLMWKSADPTTLLLPPLPNFLFQRDCSCWIFNGVTINPMTKPARVPETMIMETIYRFHPMFVGRREQRGRARTRRRRRLRAQYRHQHRAAQGRDRGHHDRGLRARQGPRRRPLHDLPDRARTRVLNLMGAIHGVQPEKPQFPQGDRLRAAGAALPAAAVGGAQDCQVRRHRGQAAGGPGV